jgi:hypothetical protein
MGSKNDGCGTGDASQIGEEFSRSVQAARYVPIRCGLRYGRFGSGSVDLCWMFTVMNVGSQADLAR